MTQFNQIESAILQRLARRGPCTIDELTQRLPDYSWNQVFTSLDRLSRGSFLTLRRPSTFQYVVALNSQATTNSDVTDVDQ